MKIFINCRFYFENMPATKTRVPKKELFGYHVFNRQWKFKLFAAHPHVIDIQHFRLTAF